MSGGARPGPFSGLSWCPRNSEDPVWGTRVVDSVFSHRVLRKPRGAAMLPRSSRRPALVERFGVGHSVGSDLPQKRLARRCLAPDASIPPRGHSEPGCRAERTRDLIGTCANRCPVTVVSARPGSVAPQKGGTPWEA